MCTSTFEASQLSFSKENVFISKNYYMIRRLLVWKASNKEEGGEEH